MNPLFGAGILLKKHETIDVSNAFSATVIRSDYPLAHSRKY